MTKILPWRVDLKWGMDLTWRVDLASRMDLTWRVDLAWRMDLTWRSGFDMKNRFDMKDGFWHDWPKMTSLTGIPGIYRLYMPTETEFKWLNSEIINYWQTT